MVCICQASNSKLNRTGWRVEIRQKRELQEAMMLVVIWRRCRSYFQFTTDAEPHTMLEMPKTVIINSFRKWIVVISIVMVDMGLFAIEIFDVTMRLSVIYVNHLIRIKELDALWKFILTNLFKMLVFIRTDYKLSWIHGKMASWVQVYIRMREKNMTTKMMMYYYNLLSVNLANTLKIKGYLCKEIKE